MVVVAESIQITKSCLSAKARSFLCNQLENYEERGGGGGGGGREGVLHWSPLG